MGKFLGQFAIFTGVFFLLWFGLSRIHWMDVFKVNKFTKEKQEQLSELIIKIHKMEKKEVEKPQIVVQVAGLKNTICTANNIDTADITMHVFEDDIINAFALPGGHIIVNTGLINYCDNADMLAGVIAHEIAHVELEHVSRKLAREIGVGTLVMLTGSGEHLGALKEILHTLSSRGFDRQLEREADNWSVRYMKQADADAQQLAFFLRKLSADKEIDMPRVLSWVSTHPDTDERVKDILAASGTSTHGKELISPDNWAGLKDNVKALDE